MLVPIRLAGAVALAAGCLAMPAASQAAVFHVTNTANSGAGSLRAAIVNVNASTDPSNTIDFSFGSGVATISLASALDAITKPVLIDATTQPGNPIGAPKVVLDGAGAGSSSNGLVVNAPGAEVEVKGLVIKGFGRGGLVLQDGEYTIQRNYIGTDAAGAAAAENGLDGIRILGGVGLIGGTSGAIERNVISGNNHHGIFVDPSATEAFIDVRGNYIGTNAAGTAAVPNELDGIDIEGQNVFVGTSHGDSDPGEGNVISGNLRNGVRLFGANNAVDQNLLGTAADGTTLVGNGFHGLLLDSANPQNLTLTSNTVAGNGFAGSGGLAGVSIRGDNRIFAGSFFGNSGPPIERTDDAGNQTFNPPLLTKVVASGQNFTVSGTLNTTGGGNRLVQVYGNGGRVYLGAGVANSGVGPFSFDVAAQSGVTTFTANQSGPGVLIGGGSSEFGNSVALTAGGSVGGGQGSQGGGGGGGGLPQVTDAALKGLLDRSLAAFNGNITQALVVQALLGGKAAFSFYQGSVVPKTSARRKRRKPVLLARTSRNFAAPGTARLKLKLTRKGKRAFRRKRRIRATAVASFTPTGRPKVTTRRTLTLKRPKPKRRRKR